MESWEPQLRVTGHQGRWSGRAVSDMLGVGTAATRGLVTLSCSLYPLTLTLQASVGSQWLPCVETFKEISKSSPRDAKVWEQKEFTKPLPEPTMSYSTPPWGEVGFTHTNDLVQPKTCCLESWPHSILTCTFFLPALIFFFWFLFFLSFWNETSYYFSLLLQVLSFSSVGLPSMPSPPRPFPQRKGGWVRTLPTQSGDFHPPVGEAEPDSACARLFLSTDPQVSHLRSIG